MSSNLCFWNSWSTTFLLDSIKVMKVAILSGLCLDGSHGNHSQILPSPHSALTQLKARSSFFLWGIGRNLNHPFKSNVWLSFFYYLNTVKAIDMFFLKLTSTSASQEMTSYKRSAKNNCYNLHLVKGTKFMNNSKPFVTALNQTIWGVLVWFIFQKG